MKKFLVLGLFSALCMVIAGAAQESRYGGTLRYAMIDEPPTLDLMVVTSDLSSTIGQHIFETLFTFDENYAPTPLLVESYERNDDATEVTLHLRKGVHFHNGKEMTSGDVLASLERWGKYGVRGPIMFAHVIDLSAVDPYTVRIRFDKPFAPMESLLAFNNGGPCILPKEIAENAGAEPINPEQYIGTGPYKFSEWIPGKYIRLVRFENYNPSPASPSGYGGCRNAYFDELLFIPVPDPGTRVAGVQAGDYDYAEMISADLYEQLRADPNIATYLLIPPSFPCLFRNTKQGIMANDKMYQAILAALDMDPIIEAAFGPLGKTNGSIFAPGTVWYTTAGTELYDQGNPEKAQQLAKEAGYSGQPIRYMTTTSYEWIYNVSLVVADQLRRAGFNIDFQVYDWATLVSRRVDPELWDLFQTGHGPVPDPALITALSSTYPGWWDTPQKERLMEQFLTTVDFNERYEIWEEIQTLLYEEGSMIKIGDGYTLNIASKHVKGLDDPHHPSLLWPYFWNVWKEES